MTSPSSEAPGSISSRLTGPRVPCWAGWGGRGRFAGPATFFCSSARPGNGGCIRGRRNSWTRLLSARTDSGPDPLAWGPEGSVSGTSATMPVLAGRGCARVEIRSPQTRASLPDFVNKVLLGHGGAHCCVQGLPRGSCRGRRRGPAPRGRASPALGAGGAPPLPPSEDGAKSPILRSGRGRQGVCRQGHPHRQSRHMVPWLPAPAWGPPPGLLPDLRLHSFPGL